MEPISKKESKASISNATSAEDSITSSISEISMSPPPLQFSPSATEDSTLKDNFGEFAGLANEFQEQSGADVSGIKVVRNNSLLNKMDAKGITVGGEIFMNSNDSPHSQDSKDTFMHEMVHQMQRKSNKVVATSEKDGVPINDDLSLETEAENWSTFKASGMNSNSAKSPIQQAKAPFQLKSKTDNEREKVDTSKEPFQLKPLKKQRGPHVKLPTALNSIILSYNAYLQFFDLGKEMWDEINKLKSAEGWIDKIGQKLGVSENKIPETLAEYKKKVQKLNPANNKSPDELTDEQISGTHSKQLGHAVEGTTKIVGQAAFQGIKILAKLKSVNLTDAFFWGLDQVVSNEYKDEVKDFKSIFGLGKLKDFGKKLAADQVASKIYAEFYNTKYVNSEIRKAGFGNSKYRKKAVSATEADFKASIKIMLGNTRGISLNKSKFWKDLGKVRSTSSAKSFLRKSNKYLKVNPSKAMQSNDLIFNSRFVRQFTQEYANAKNEKD